MRQALDIEPDAKPVPRSRRPAFRRPPPHATISREVHCAACWYNLRGLAFLGRCPECGTRYDVLRNIKLDDARVKGAARRKRYLRTITHEPILGPLDMFRAGAFVVLLVSCTGVLGLIVAGIRSLGRTYFGW
ncbi:MAG: hypothetical protein IT438_05515 [Phycisphaerales bacterium]|nr:hypothetical protein [Phycisphaerales bacterium]